MSSTNTQNTEIQLLKQEIHSLADEVRRTNHLITGNGTPERGIVVRLDRLEQKNKTISRISWTAATALVGLVIHTVWNLVAGTKGAS